MVFKVAMSVLLWSSTFWPKYTAFVPLMILQISQAWQNILSTVCALQLFFWQTVANPLPFHKENIDMLHSNIL